MKATRNLLLLFHGIMFVMLSGAGIRHFTGITPWNYLYFVALAAIVGAVVTYWLQMAPAMRQRVFGPRVAAFAITVALLAAYGWVRGNAALRIFFDTSTYVILLCFYILGTSDELWRRTERWLLLGFWIGVVMVALTLDVKGSKLDDTPIVEGYELANVDFLAYRLSATMSYCPVLFAMAIQRRKWNIWRLLGVGSIFVYLVVEIYFQKRAPTARLLTYIAMAFLVTSAVRKRVSPALVIATLVGCAVVYQVTASSVLPQLANKYQTEDTSRFEEGLSLIEQFDPQEFVVGRGMGGTYVPPVGWRAGLVEDDSGRLVRDLTHIGILTPVLKGGLLFLALYLSLAGPLLARKAREWRSNPINLAALMVLPVVLVFLLIEGPPSLQNFYDAAIYGMACARFIGVRQPATDEADEWERAAPPGKLGTAT